MVHLAAVVSPDLLGALLPGPRRVVHRQEAPGSSAVVVDGAVVVVVVVNCVVVTAVLLSVAVVKTSVVVPPVVLSVAGVVTSVVIAAVVLTATDLVTSVIVSATVAVTISEITPSNIVEARGSGVVTSSPSVMPIHDEQNDYNNKRIVFHLSIISILLSRTATLSSSFKRLFRTLLYISIDRGAMGVQNLLDQI